MTVLRTLAELQSALMAHPGPRGYVPTMGALHAGHLALVEAARARYDAVLVSIFVNPTQFGPGEDFEAYPRQLEDDLQALEPLGVRWVFAPDPGVLYPEDADLEIHMPRLGARLEGAFRPHHFGGVALVLTKLFNLITPDAVFMGSKDYQQVVVTRRLVDQLFLPIDIVAVPTVREADGLALSSRNVYLSPNARRQAPALFRSLQRLDEESRTESDTTLLTHRAVTRLLEAGFGPVDYVEIVEPSSLEPLPEVRRPAVVVAAAWLEQTRLIDNLELRD